MTSVTDKLAHFIQETAFDRIPPEAVTVAKRAIVDTVACALAGSAAEPGRIVAALVREMGASPQASVVAAGFLSSAPSASLANGTMAHAIDYDDVQYNMMGHPSAPLLPAVLAAAELVGATGKDVTTAYVVGFEVESKIGKAVNPSHYGHGWHATGTLGTFGAAAAAAKLLNLSPEQIRMALGIAASEAAGLKKNIGSMTKPYHAGQAAWGGMMAALLAERGFTADPDIFSGETGFAHVYSSGGEYDLAAMAKGLGDPYEIVSPGLSLKPYPSCRCTHSGIDGMLGLIAQHHLTYDEVESIEVGVCPMSAGVLFHHDPKTGLEAKFSMEYCATAALIHGRVGIAEFSDETVNHPQAKELVRRSRLHVPEEWKDMSDFGTFSAQITVKLRSGRTLDRLVQRPKGDPETPMSEGECLAKFHDCASLALDEERSTRLAEHLFSIEQWDEIETVMADLRGNDVARGGRESRQRSG